MDNGEQEIMGDIIIEKERERETVVYRGRKE